MLYIHQQYSFPKLIHRAKVKFAQSCPSNSLGSRGLYSPWNSPGQSIRVGSLCLLQGIFPTQVLKPGLPHCRRILHQLSHKGSQRILQWVAYLFSSGSSQPRNQTGVLYCRQILYQLSYQTNPLLLSDNFPSPLFPAPVSSIAHSVSVILPIACTSCKQYNTVFSFSDLLISLSLMLSKFIHVVTCQNFLPF